MLKSFKCFLTIMFVTVALFNVQTKAVAKEITAIYSVSDSLRDGRYAYGPTDRFSIFFPGWDFNTSIHMHAEENAQFTEYDDKTARLKGTFSFLNKQTDMHEVWEAEINFRAVNLTSSHSRNQTLNQNPYLELKDEMYQTTEQVGLVNVETWHYYNVSGGKLKRLSPNTNAHVVITPRNDMPPFQIGKGANGRNINFGASGWVKWTLFELNKAPKFTESDINIDLELKKSDICAKNNKLCNRADRDN